MVFAAIFGLLILAVTVYVSLKVLGNVLYGVVMIALIFLASYLIVGSFPSLKEVPFIGGYIPDLPDFSGLTSQTGSAIAVVRNLLYNLKILSLARASNGNLLVSVANAGQMELSNFSVYVDSQPAQIVNKPKDPLKSGESTMIELAWKSNIGTVMVRTAKTSAAYPPA